MTFKRIVVPATPAPTPSITDQALGGGEGAATCPHCGRCLGLVDGELVPHRTILGMRCLSPEVSAKIREIRAAVTVKP